MFPHVLLLGGAMTRTPPQFSRKFSAKSKTGGSRRRGRHGRSRGIQDGGGVRTGI